AMSATTLPLSVAGAAGSALAAPSALAGAGAGADAAATTGTDGAAPATAAEAFAARAQAPAAPAAPVATTLAHTGVAAPAPQSPASVGSLGGAVFALVLVVGLILGLAWLVRRMPGLGGGAANPALRIVGSLALGPRDRLVVVEVGQTQLLLGVGAGGTRTLHTLDQDRKSVV